MTLSPELVDKAGLRLISELTRLPRAEAQEKLLALDKFSNDELLELLSLSKRQPNQVADHKVGYYDRRRRCFAALWILGASWSQISMLYEVSRQTVMQSANRIIKNDRTRLAERALYEVVSAYNNKFWIEDAAHKLDITWSALQLANHLLLNTELDDGNE